jgi:uncharacterized phage protein gp47/JayE
MAVLPDYLNEQTEVALLRNLLDRIPADVDKSEGSYIWDALAPVALELYAAANWAQEVLKRGFASTAFGPYLDLRCEEHGVVRRPASTASGTVEISGNAGTVVPAGTRVATLTDSDSETNSIEFETTVDGVLDGGGKALLAIIAVEAGAKGNVPSGAIALLAQSVSGINGVLNLTETYGGSDIETDASLLERYYIKIRRPGTSGNKADYMQWALEIAGVGGVQVEPIWAGPGTVRLFILDSEKRAAGTELVGNVQEAIAPSAGLGEGKAPIGATVTVVPATEVPVNVSGLLTLASGADPDDVRDAVGNAVTGYLKQLAFADPMVRYSRFASILLDIEGIVDVLDLRVNGGTANLEMQIGQVAVLGMVSLDD